MTPTAKQKYKSCDSHVEEPEKYTPNKSPALRAGKHAPGISLAARGHFVQFVAGVCECVCMCACGHLVVVKQKRWSHVAC